MLLLIGSNLYYATDTSFFKLVVPHDQTPIKIFTYVSVFVLTDSGDLYQFEEENMSLTRMILLDASTTTDLKISHLPRVSNLRIVVRDISSSNISTNNSHASCFVVISNEGHFYYLENFYRSPIDNITILRCYRFENLPLLNCFYNYYHRDLNLVITRSGDLLAFQNNWLEVLLNGGNPDGLVKRYKDCCDEDDHDFVISLSARKIHHFKSNISLLSSWYTSNHSYGIDETSGNLMRFFPGPPVVMMKVSQHPDYLSLDPRERVKRFFTYRDGFYFLSNDEIIVIEQASEITQQQIDTLNSVPLVCQALPFDDEKPWDDLAIPLSDYIYILTTRVCS